MKILQQWVLPAVFARLLQLYLTLRLFQMLKLLNVVDDGVLQEVKGKYAMTGKMSEISRKDLERVLNSKGFDLTNTISADLKGLFVGDKPSSKLAKAQKLGIPLLSFEDLDKV